MTGLGFLNGKWEELRDEASKVILIEPLVEAVIQLTIQFLIIILIIHSHFLEKGNHNWEGLKKKFWNFPYRGVATDFGSVSIPFSF